MHKLTFRHHLKKLHRTQKASCTDIRAELVCSRANIYQIQEGITLKSICIFKQLRSHLGKFQEHASTVALNWHAFPPSVMEIFAVPFLTLLEEFYLCIYLFLQ